MRTTFLAMFLLGAATTACTTGQGAPDAAVAGPMTAELGNAGVGEPHVEVGNDASVRVIFGPQGGWHIWASLHAQHTDPSGLRAQFDLLEGTTVVGSTLRRTLQLTPVGGSVLEAKGITMLFNEGQHPPSWDGGHAIHVKVTLDDRAGNHLVLERDWNATCCDPVTDAGL